MSDIAYRIPVQVVPRGPPCPLRLWASYSRDEMRFVLTTDSDERALEIIAATARGVLPRAHLQVAMKYIAILSGGKDSCYNLLHCHKNGHELVAAASLRPEPGKGA
jgi:hypothetical protein